ncbi:ComF family protein [Solitalea koreensis]|uniref:ComF family protein n=1 Tax=Solitalea koreensis TaxID=543615 RepID=A0A521CQ84_9SPHI|nr:phosphoribosyltransferase family protein [Solitalea koreensis]SMO61634.1 comF family protein [Solitalea koreensis]
MIKTYLSDFAALLFPELCQACGNNLFRGEELICTYCLHNLPYTNFHHDPENAVAKQFWGKVHIENAAACFYFRKGGKVQNLLHQLKYKGNKAIGEKIGKIYGHQLKLSNAFKNIDLIIPVPLHQSKLKIRGYNQANSFAQGLSTSMNLEINENVLKKILATETQTRKNRFQRFENVENIFAVDNPEFVKGKHILIADDVVTTGSTLQSCAEVLLNAGCKKVSIVVISYAK